MQAEPRRGIDRAETMRGGRARVDVGGRVLDIRHSAPDRSAWLRRYPRQRRDRESWIAEARCLRLVPLRDGADSLRRRRPVRGKILEGKFGYRKSVEASIESGALCLEKIPHLAGIRIRSATTVQDQAPGWTARAARQCAASAGGRRRRATRRGDAQHATWGTREPAYAEGALHVGALSNGRKKWPGTHVATLGANT